MFNRFVDDGHVRQKAEGWRCRQLAQLDVIVGGMSGRGATPPHCAAAVQTSTLDSIPSAKFIFVVNGLLIETTIIIIVIPATGFPLMNNGLIETGETQLRDHFITLHHHQSIGIVYLNFFLGHIFNFNIFPKSNNG